MNGIDLGEPELPLGTDTTGGVVGGGGGLGGGGAEPAAAVTLNQALAEAVSPFESVTWTTTWYDPFVVGEHRSEE